MRVLVLSASVGAGHLRAAEAIELALRQLHPEATVRNLDVLPGLLGPFPVANVLAEVCRRFSHREDCQVGGVAYQSAARADISGCSDDRKGDSDY